VVKSTGTFILASAAAAALSTSADAQTATTSRANSAKNIVLRVRSGLRPSMAVRCGGSLSCLSHAGHSWLYRREWRAIKSTTADEFAKYPSASCTQVKRDPAYMSSPELTSHGFYVSRVMIEQSMKSVERQNMRPARGLSDEALFAVGVVNSDRHAKSWMSVRAGFVFVITFPSSCAGLETSRLLPRLRSGD
jgi:hypothetical protein